MSLGHYKSVLQFHKGVLHSTCPREFGQRETINSDLSGRPAFPCSRSKILQRAAEHPMQHLFQAVHKTEAAGASPGDALISA